MSIEPHVAIASNGVILPMNANLAYLSVDFCKLPKYNEIHHGHFDGRVPCLKSYISNLMDAN